MSVWQSYCVRIVYVYIFIIGLVPMLYAEHNSSKRIKTRHQKSHYIEQVNPFVHINWTEAKIYVIVHKDLQTDTDLSITQARTLARHQALQEAHLKLKSAVYELHLDAHNQIKDKLKQDINLRKRMATLSERFLFEGRRTASTYVSITLSLPFLGKNGLYALLMDEGYATERLPQVSTEELLDPVSGLIIVVDKQTTDFQLSLAPRIYSSTGLLVHGPEIAGRKCFMQKGLVSYSRSIETARKSPRVGISPYISYASVIKGQSDLVLDNSDVEKILGNPDGRKALHNCRITLVISAND